jgi:hypothetical protein
MVFHMPLENVAVAKEILKTNCRGGEHGRYLGRLKLGPMDTGGSEEG